MSNILVTAIGSFSGSTVIKELKKDGHFIIGCDIHPEKWIIESKDVDVFIKAPYYSAENYVEFIQALCEKNKVEFIIPLTDPEVEILSKYKEKFKMLGITVCTSDAKTISLCKDKYNLYTYLKKNKLCNTIETYLLSKVNIEECNFPLFSKPRNGRSSENCMIINDRIDYEYLSKKDAEQKFMVQPYIKGMVITVDVVRNCASNKIECVARRELIRTKSGAGITVEIIKNNKLEKICIDIASSLNIIGAVNMEFIESDDGEYYFLEVNPRFSAGIAFTETAGYPIVMQHLNCFINNKDFINVNINKLLMCKKYEEYIIENILQ